MTTNIVLIRDSKSLFSLMTKHDTNAISKHLIFYQEITKSGFSTMLYIDSRAL